MLRRRVRQALPLELVDWLLEGGTRPCDDGNRAEGRYDPFVMFIEPTPDLAALWRQHRAILLAEAARRGIAAPWGLQFDEGAAC